MAYGTVKAKRKVYAGPSTSSVLLGEIGPEAEVEIIRKEGSYYVIECTLNNTSGVVWGFIASTAISSSTIVGEVPKATLKSSYSLCHQTPLYTGAGSHYKRLDVVEEGTILKVYDIAPNGYQYVEFYTAETKNVRGYIAGGALYTSIDTVAYVKKEVPIYHTASTAYDAMGKIGPRQTVRIINKTSSSSAYYYIEAHMSDTGELVRGYITTGSASMRIGELTYLPTDSQSFVLDRGVTVYAGPGAQYKSIDTMAANEVVLERALW